MSIDRVPFRPLSVSVTGGGGGGGGGGTTIYFTDRDPPSVTDVDALWWQRETGMFWRGLGAGEWTPLLNGYPAHSSPSSYFGIALGEGSTAEQASVAIGILSWASAEGVAVGSEARTLNEGSVAIGKQAIAHLPPGDPIESVCVGSTAEDWGGNAICIGTSAFNNGVNGVVVGSNAYNEMESGVNIGSASSTDAERCINVGCYSTSIGFGSINVGTLSSAGNGHGAINVGSYSVARAPYSVLVGYSSLVGWGGSGVGPSPGAICIGSESASNGPRSIAIGFGVTTSGMDQAVIGAQNLMIEYNYTGLDGDDGPWGDPPADPSTGLILSSPNGTRFRIYVDDTGNLFTEEWFG